MPTQPNVSKGRLKTICLAAGLIAGCEAAPKANPPVRPPPTPPTVGLPTTMSASTRPAPSADDVIATVGTTQIRRGELVTPLLEAYGFNLLMLVVQRDMARDACAQQNFVVTPADVKWEYDWTLNQMFPTLGPTDDREKVLDQFLAQPKPRDQTATRAEFDVIIDTNAHLRKLVEPTISRAVTDELLQQQFDEDYGAQVKVRAILVANPQEAIDVRRRLDAGEDFAAVARQISRDPQTKRLGGELPPFGMNSTRLPDNFKRVAFAMKPGEVSDPVQAGGGIYLIKLEQRIAPKAVKFADVKDSLRQDYQAKLVVEGVKAVRAKLAQQALAQLSITEPTLKAEFDKRLAARDQVIRDREKIREQMEKDRAKDNAPPAVPPSTSTKPADVPTAATATAPTAPAATPVLTTPAPTTATTPVAPTTKPAAAVVPPAPKPATVPASMPDTVTTAEDPIAPPAATPTTAPAAPATAREAPKAPTPAVRDPAAPASTAPASAAPAVTAPATRPS